MERIILHSDLNNFYASVACLYDPDLRGKPVAVAGDAEARHGIVLAKNDAAKRCGEIAEEKFQSWGIPGRYLVFGDPKDLKDLMAKELAEATPVPVEEPKPKKYKDEYIIPGYGFRMLVGDIHHLIVLYYSLARRLSEAETEKDFLRLKKKAGGYEKVLKKLFRSLGLPEDSNAAQDVLEESIIRRHNLIRLEDVEEPQDEGDLEGDEVWSD